MEFIPVDIYSFCEKTQEHGRLESGFNHLFINSVFTVPQNVKCPRTSGSGALGKY